MLLAFNAWRHWVVQGSSQEQLALEAELDRTYISAIERGRVNVSIDNIERLAKTLQVEPWERCYAHPALDGVVEALGSF